MTISYINTKTEDDDIGHTPLKSSHLAEQVTMCKELKMQSL